ncbi:hypothetical protein [Winogradskyella sp.]|uniref:hypothetical protein n=1 Tax=Winogradskyella sp. TaxID=1883156 RepID=UPI0025E97B12|nr:hypothetical protein [Winogradskyella sp.]
MKLFKTVDKIFARFGNIRAMERTHVDSFTEGLIAEIKGDKIAESDFGQLYTTYQNLSGYDFLNVSLLSGTNIKTYKGCYLIFELPNNTTITLPSDTKEIESDFSNVSNRYLTKITFIVNKSEQEIISKGNFNKVFLNFKKKSLPMDKV